MAQTVLLPKLGQTVEEAAIVKWHVSEGDTIKKGDVLFEIETDKAVLEAESFFDGVLLKILVGENILTPVSSVVAYIGEKGEKVPDAPPPPAAPAAKPGEVVEKKTETAATATPTENPASVTKPAAINKADIKKAPRIAPAIPAAQTAEPARQFISPRANALVKHSVINPANIQGSGPNGRIVEKDVRSYMDSMGYNSLKISPAAKTMAAANQIDILSLRADDTGRIKVDNVKCAIAEKPVKMSKMRKIIADRLGESFAYTPHFYVTVSVDMTDLMAYRQELKDAGKAYSVTDFILESVILSLKEYPVVNSFTDGSNIAWRGSVELGMAVGLEEGLVVPVISNAEDLSMEELHNTAKSLAKKAREGKLLPDEMSGSSFTVSNMGMFNVDNFNAIINPGEGAILAVASTKETVVAINGEMQIRSIMKITLSVDHRIVDGTVGAQFVNEIKNKLEDIELWKTLT